jgi:hypothetical protein
MPRRRRPIGRVFKAQRQGTHKAVLSVRPLAPPPRAAVGAMAELLLQRCGYEDVAASVPAHQGLDSRECVVVGVEVVRARARHFARLMGSYRYGRGREWLAAADLDLQHGNGLDLSLGSYDVIFINNLAFPQGKDSLTARLQRKLHAELQPGARVFSLLPLALDGGEQQTLVVPEDARVPSYCARGVVDRVYLHTHGQLTTGWERRKQWERRFFVKALSPSSLSFTPV